MLIRFLVIYLVFITRIKQNACSTTKSLSENTNSEGTETNTEPMTPQTDSEEETLQDDEETTPLTPSSDDTTESTASISKSSCGSFWHYNEVMRCLYESLTLSPETDCANSSCPAKTCDISQLAHQCMSDFSEVQEWKKQMIQRQAMNPLAVRKVHVGLPIRIRPGRLKNSWSDEVRKITSDREHAKSREAERNSDVWRLLLSKNKILLGHKQRQLIQLMNSTKKYPFSLTTVDEESKNKTAELIKLVQEAEIVPHQLDLKKPQLQPKRRSNSNPWVLNYRPQIYLQNQGYLQPALLRNERRYFISNPDVIERYINSRRSRKRRKKGYSTSLESDSGVLRRMENRLTDGGAWPNEGTVVKETVAEERDAGKVNYDERSDDYIVSTTKNARDDEPGEWVTTKYNWDDVHSSNDSSAEKSHKDESAKESAEDEKHNKEQQPAKENTHPKTDKDLQKEVKEAISEATKWHDRDVAVKVESILKEKGFKNKPSNAKKDEWGDWAKPERATYKNSNEGLFIIQDEAEKKYATQEANPDESATRRMHTKKKMKYEKEEHEIQSTKHEYLDYKDDGYTPGKSNKPSKQEQNEAGSTEGSERFESSERSERTEGPKNINGYHGLNKPSRVERPEEPERPDRSKKKKDYEEDYDSKKYTKKDMNIIDGWTKEKEQKNKKQVVYEDYDYTNQKKRDKNWNRDYDRQKYNQMDSNEKYEPRKHEERSHDSEENRDNGLEKHTLNIERIAKGIDVKWSDEEDRRGENEKSNEDIKSENTKISDNKKASKKSRPHHDDTSKDWGKGKQADWSQENKQNWRDKTGENPKPNKAPTEFITHDKKKQTKNKNRGDYDFWNRHAHNDWDRVGVDWNKKDETKRTKKDMFPQIVKTTLVEPERWNPRDNNDWDKVAVGKGKQKGKQKGSYEREPQIQRSEDKRLPVYFGYVHTPLPYKQQKSIYDD